MLVSISRAQVPVLASEVCRHPARRVNVFHMKTGMIGCREGPITINGLTTILVEVVPEVSIPRFLMRYDHPTIIDSINCLYT